MLSTINGVEISCISAVLPKNEETIYKRLSPYLSEKKIKRLENNIGFSNFATTIQGQTAGDLCFCAAEKLIKQTKIARDSIDAIIFLSQMPDYISPPTSFILQSKLKLSNNVIAIDVNHGCPGYVYGLYLASCLISGGNCKRVLLCVGDTKSKVVYPGDISTSAIFGDAGSATLVDKGTGIIPFHIKSIGEKHGAIMTKRGMGKLEHISINDSYADENILRENYLMMDGTAVMDFTLDEVPESIICLLNESKITAGEIDIYGVHQANKIILNSIAQKLNILSEKMPFLANKTGNVSSASIPLMIADNPKIFKQGRVFLSGFGVGLSIANSILDLSKTEVIDVSKV